MDNRKQEKIVFDDILAMVKKDGLYLRHNLIDIILRLLAHGVRQKNMALNVTEEVLKDGTVVQKHGNPCD